MKIFKTKKKTQRLKAVLDKYKVRMKDLEKHITSAAKRYKESVEAERIGMAKRANKYSK
jgi:hypothetical protein